MKRKGPRILLVGGTYRALCVLERLLERGEQVVAFLGQEGEGERDFCSEILEICDRASIPARSGRKLGEEMVRWLEDRIRPELSISVGLSGQIPLSVGGNCRLGMLEIVDLFQSETCPGVVLRQRGQDVAVRAIPEPVGPEHREEAYLQMIEETLSAVDEFLDRLGASFSGSTSVIPFDPPAVSFEDLSQIVEWPDAGPATVAFEDAVSRYLEADRVFATRSLPEAFGTILAGLEVGEGDDVLCPGVVSGAVVEAVRRVGAQPVWVDVDPDRVTIDPRRVSEAATPRTRVMVISHAFGQPAALDELYGVAAELGLEVLEDGANSIGARFGSSRLGRSPCTCVFGFPGRVSGVRPLMALVTLSPALESRLGRVFEKFRVGDGLARIAQRTFDAWDDVLSTRREIAREYSTALVPYDAFRVPSTPEGALPVYPCFLLRLTRFARTTAEDLSKLLRESGLENRRMIVPASERELAKLPCTEESRETSVLLPIHRALSPEHRERTLDAIFDYAIG
jgi:dTDP-4-amino-4,6-dideoxygalactose transaminase